MDILKQMLANLLQNGWALFWSFVVGLVISRVHDRTNRKIDIFLSNHMGETTRERIDWISRNFWRLFAVYVGILLISAFFQGGPGKNSDPTPTNEPEPTNTIEPTSTPLPTSTLTPTPIRNLALQDECAPQPLPTNMPCQYETISPGTDSPYEIASFLFRRNTELAEKYAGAIYELLRNESGYYGGTTRGSIVLERLGWVIVPSIDEARDFEYYYEYLKYELCSPNGKRPCLYVVSELTAIIGGINDYESIAQYFGNSELCVEKANRTIFVNSKNYPDQVIEIEDGVVLIIPLEEIDCEYL